MLKITPLNDDKASEGTWTKYRNVDLKITRAGNDKFQRVFSSLTRPHKFQMDKGTLDDGIMKEILCQSIGKTILVNWKNFKVDGKEVKYSEENSFDLLFNDPDCREFVQAFSQDVQNFLKEEEDSIEKKS